ncbi:hypothetical protein GCM10023085_06260 [Actinomadura viridis]
MFSGQLNFTNGGMCIADPGYVFSMRVPVPKGWNFVSVYGDVPDDPCEVVIKVPAIE